MLWLDKVWSQGGEAGLNCVACLLVDLGLSPVELQHAVRRDAGVDAIRAVVVKTVISFEIHLAQDLRQLEEPLSQHEKQHLSALARLREVGEGALRPLDQLGDRFGAVELGITRLRFRNLGSRQSVVCRRVPHEFGKAVQLDAAIAVNSEAVAVNFDQMTRDQNVSLNQREMDI